MRIVMRFRPGNGGFTLVEMSMVLVVVGIFLAGWISYYTLYVKNRDITKARENIQLMMKDIDAFYSTNVFNKLGYPCPAPMNLPRTDPGFGQAFNATCDPSLPPFNLNTALLSPGTPFLCNNGICIVRGNRDTGRPPAGNEPIVVGAYPVRNMALAASDTNYTGHQGLGETEERSTDLGYEADSIDPWGSQYTYAVTLSMAQPGQFRFYDGVIGVQDEFGQPTAGINNDGHYVIISHGPNRRGAFSASTGVQDVPCGQDPVDDPINGAQDNENCDLDGTFVQALGNYEGNSTAFYDDLIRVRGPMPSQIWQQIDPTNELVNLNEGNVGVGTDTPNQPLHVAGALRALSPPLAANPPVEGTLICDTSGTANCFPIANIATTGIACPAGKIMRGVKGGASRGSSLEPICDDASFSLNPNQSCPVGPPQQWIVGINSNGDIICAP